METRSDEPPAAKGIYMQKATLSTSMGPGVKVDLGRLAAPGSEQ